MQHRSATNYAAFVIHLGRKQRKIIPADPSRWTTGWGLYTAVSVAGLVFPTREHNDHRIEHSKK
jgi:hypothetical protein